MRLEYYYEDVEIAEGKAVWANPGGSYRWGSPSFVVDQTGKGVLGRPVRDCRWPNSQTLDKAWPAADAEACLRTSHKGTVHSSFDCVWGFTQVGITPKISEILALNTRRGLLLPKVVHFGPKQGPGIFQALVDSEFGHLKDSAGNEYVSAFVDDCSISIAPLNQSEPEDAVFDRHISQLSLLFAKAAQKKIQFMLEKS